MAQDVNEQLQNRRRLMGLPENAGRMSMARYGEQGMALNEGADPRVLDRFGHILGGALREKIEKFDGFNAQESPFFNAPTRLNPNGENGEGGREAAALGGSMGPKRQDMRGRRRPQEQQKKVSNDNFIVPVTAFAATSGPEARELAEINAMFGGDGRGYSSSRSNLMPERGHNTSLELDQNYYSSAPFDPMTQIRRKAATGTDYRQLESRRSGQAQDEQPFDRSDNHQNQQYINEMARTMAEATIKMVMQEYVEKNKGKQYFKEVKTSHKFDSPTAKLVEMDGKYYKMELKPVKVNFKR